MHLQNPGDILEVRDGTSMCLPSLKTHCISEANEKVELESKRVNENCWEGRLQCSTGTSSTTNSRQAQLTLGTKCCKH